MKRFIIAMTVGAALVSTGCAEQKGKSKDDKADAKKDGEKDGEKKEEKKQEGPS